MYKLLISRRLAIYLLTAVLLALTASALIPNNFTLSAAKWLELERKSPVLFWIYAHLSTPFLVRNPFFQLISFLLCLSTLACTADRIVKWGKSKCMEFEKEKAFSFSVTQISVHCPDEVRSMVENFLSKGRWEISRENNTDLTVISGQKGMSGFWGSVAFHAGLVCCFLAGPVTVLTGFSGELTATEDVVLPLRGAIVAHQVNNDAKLPEAQVQINQLRGEYFQGQYRYDYGGELVLSDRLGDHRIPFAVNKPASYHGYQFSLNEYGDAPRLVLERDGKTLFDYYLNLKHPGEGDYFELEPGVRAMVIFFPDFFRQGDKIGSRSRRSDNPVTLVRIFRGDREVFKGLFKPGDEEIWEGSRIRVPDYRHWVTLNVTKEQGILLVMLGFLLGSAGLLVRFLSNERRIEFELFPMGEQTGFKVRGYCRYYPAFLEKEVLEIAQKLEEGQVPVARP
ncbi:MAG: cytochrome c biogenesis protein ResB [Desulfuromonadales bacterium]|nr:cytochrome c biogenesis protein ResB [Desulfuromonadales bacterium]